MPQTDYPRISLNASGSVVSVEYSGHISVEGMRAHSAEVEKLKLKPGFIVYSDLTDLVSMDPECAPLVSHVMDVFNKFGAGRVVRVIPDPKKDIGLGILTLFHYKRGIPVNTVPTRAEAAHLL